MNSLTGESRNVGQGLSSMTGYGRGEATEGACAAIAEICSVNRRQFDIRLQLPRCLALRETAFIEKARARLSRGHVTGSVQVMSKNGNPGVNGLSLAQCQAAIGALRDAAASLGLRDDLCASHLLRLSAESGTPSFADSAATVESVAMTAFSEALEALCGMRVEEGARLERDLKQRLAWLRGRVDVIAARAPEVPVAHRALLQKRLEEAGHAGALEDDALRRELLLFATRSDITEELTRLRSHFEQADEFIRSRGPVGRALDFLVQEMGREINTLGVKAADARISREVVGFKTQLDRFREQVQNIE